MKKVIRNVMLVALILAVVVCVLTLCACDLLGIGNNGGVEGDVEYFINAAIANNGETVNVKIKDGAKPEKITVKSVYKGKKVQLDASSFSGSGVREIVLEEGFADIPESVFAGLESLEKITLPESVTEIKNYAFSGCISLKDIAFPKNLKTVGDQAFQRCTGLENITIPNATETLGTSAFADCGDVNGITVPASVTNMGSDSGGVFYGTYAKNISMPSFAIPHVPVNKCENLVITSGETVTKFYLKANTESYGGPKTLKIADTVTEIEKEACKEFVRLESLSLPDGVKNIGEGAFAGCVKLKTVEFGSALKTIGDSAFYGCKSLTEVRLPGGMTSIGAHSFYGCGNLKKARVTAVTVGNEAFSNCSKLSELTITGEVYEIGNAAFKNCANISGVNIPDNVNSIGDEAFYGCRYMTNLKLGEGLKYIGQGAFYRCDSLTETVLPSGVESVATKAFYGGALVIRCESPKRNGVSFSVPVIWNCYGNNLDENGFYYTDVNTDGLWLKVNEKEKTAEVYVQPASLTGEISIGSTYRPTPAEFYIITSIAEGAFAECNRVTDIKIPNSIQYIGSNAFSNGYTTLRFEREKTDADNNYDLKCPVIWSYKSNDLDENGYAYKAEKNGVRYRLKDGEAVVIKSSPTYDLVTISDVIEYKRGEYAVTEISEGAFANVYCLSQTFVVPVSVKRIGDAFYENAEVFYQGGAEAWKGVSAGIGYVLGRGDAADTNPRPPLPDGIYEYSVFLYVKNEQDVPAEPICYWRYVNGVPTVWGDER